MLLLPIHPAHFSISLLYRYSLIYASDSSVHLVKMTHDCQRTTFGLKATRFIPSGSFIMETCSSMSLDRASKRGPSTIEATIRQLGPQEPRLILGLFRLVNHDCKLNAHVRVLLSSLSSFSDLHHLDLPYTQHACLCHTGHQKVRHLSR